MAKWADLAALTEADRSADLLLVHDTSSSEDKKANLNTLLGDIPSTISAHTTEINDHEDRISDAEDKLDTIEQGAEKNVQPDWDQTDSSADNYIKNKPAGLTVDSALSSTSENSLQNKVITANLGTVLNSDSQTSAKAISIPGITSLFSGLTVKVCFINGHSGSSFTLNLNSLGAKTIYTNKCGSTVAMPSHSISSVNWYIQKYTTLELVYSTAIGGWLVLGNPEVITYTSDTVSYRIKADGLTEQFGVSSTNNDGINIVNYPVEMTTTSYAISICHKDGSSPAVGSNYQFQQYNSATTTQLGFYCAGTTRQNGYTWRIIGY